TPRPMCLSCRSPLDVTLDACACPACGAAYRSEWGNPYVLADFSKVYSPKTIAARPSAEALGRYIADHASALPRAVALVGFGRSTRYAIRALQAPGITTVAVHADNPLYAGHSVCGVPIRPGAPAGFALTLPAELT